MRGAGYGVDAVRHEGKEAVFEGAEPSLGDGTGAEVSFDTGLFLPLALIALTT
jgi:hypothetical protein